MNGLYKLTFFAFLGIFLFVLAPVASAETSPDTCVSWTTSCEGVTVAAALSWKPLTQADINEIRSGCSLVSVNYTVTIIGVGSVAVGAATSYTWRPLTQNTTYQWRVRSDYQCAIPFYTGSIYTNTYSFLTPSCNQAPNKPSTTASESWNHCSFQDVSVPTLNWTYSDYEGDPQISYEVRIKPSSSFPPTPGADEFTASGGASTAYAPIPTTWAAYMVWNQNYWWIVRVKDAYHWSDWSDANPFTTPLHAYPWSGFSWTPPEPSQAEVVVFDPEDTGVSYFWTITQGTGEYTDSTGPTNESPHIKFSTTANKIKLRVTDSVPYSCESLEQEVVAQLPLPEYEEIPPVIWLKKTLAGVANFFNGLLKLGSNG